MTGLSTLEDIKKAETKAADIIEKANGEKVKMIADAKKMAEDILSQSQSKMDDERSAVLGNIEKKLVEDKNTRSRTAIQAVEKIKKSSEGKIEKEADFLYAKFMELILSDKA